VGKNKFIRITKYLLNKKSEKINIKNKAAVEKNEENVKIYFVKHLI